MTESITAILGLIAETLETIQAVNSSVGMIAEDSKQLGDEIEVVDSAVKRVESSNKNMVDNMKQVQDIMEIMTESVVDSETTTTTMLSKYEETARNVINIENVVGKLVEELGAGGFMSLNDVTVGMSVMLINEVSKQEYHTIVSKNDDNKIFVSVDGQADSSHADPRATYEVQIVVNISAGGFAFACKTAEFANAKGSLSD